MEPLRVLQVITPSRLAGAEIYVSALSQGLTARGAMVVVLCKAVPEVVSRMRGAGLDVRAGGIGGKLNALSLVRLVRLLSEERIDLINSHLSTASLAAGIAGRLRRVPVIATVHALNTAFCYRAADRLIAVSDAVKAHLVSQRIDPQRIDVIYPGVDVDHFAPAGRGEIVRRELGISSDALVVGMIAHLSKKKGHHVLLSAARRVIETRPDCKFLMAGAGPLLNPLRDTVEQLGLGPNVIFAGFREDIRDVIESMDIVALPSVSGEGLPTCITQAMALWRPVVASRLSGIPELVKDGTTGVLVTPGDPEDLAGAILNLASDPCLRASMGSAARRRAVSLFSLSASIERTWELYQRVTNARSEETALTLR